MNKITSPASEWAIDQWFNSDQPLSLAALRGKIIVVGAFQMLCPGCVSHLIPQLKEVRKLFAADDVAVVGLHTVFEHHPAMNPIALEAFLHEYRIDFPVGVDQPGGNGDSIPLTMRRYAMRGTPTILLFDRGGNLRRQTFGHVPDLLLGAQIAELLCETSIGGVIADGDESISAGCNDAVCTVR